MKKALALFAGPRTPYDAALRDLAHGRPEQALAALDALLIEERDPAARAAIVNKRGVAFVALDRREDARSAFLSALEIVAEYGPALVNLGNLELEQEHFEPAIAYYERALRSDGELASAHRHLGLAYQRIGRTVEAMRFFNRARRLEGRASAKQRK